MTKYSTKEHLISATKTFLTLFISAFLLGVQGLTSFDWETLQTILIISLATALRAILNEITPSKK